MGPIVVAGPGPTEPQAQSSPVAPLPPAKTDVDTSALPTQSSQLISPTQDDVANDQDETEEDDEPPHSTQASKLDPYSNLDNAFGGYLADEPRPMASRQHDDDDDLLF